MPDMDDQPDTTKNPGPFAHLAVRDPRTAREKEIAEFNERKRRSGSRKRWHDYWPDPSANDTSSRE
jgi:hypothetical protein